MSILSFDPDQLARRWFGKSREDLSERQAHVMAKAMHRMPVSQDVDAAFDAQATFGQRLADRVAAFGGSWAFIAGFGVCLVLWTGVNLAFGKGAIDPYPFIFLNLVLSMLAAIQAPIIMMSQNRQSQKDRLDAANDYQVNLKAEIEILALHEKLDEVRERQLREILDGQQAQIDLLNRLLASRPGQAS